MSATRSRSPCVSRRKPLLATTRARRKKVAYDGLELDEAEPALLNEVLRKLRCEAEGRVWRRQGSGTYAGQRPDGWSEHVSSLVARTDLMEVMEVRLLAGERRCRRKRRFDIPAGRCAALVRERPGTDEEHGNAAGEKTSGRLHRDVTLAPGVPVVAAVEVVESRGGARLAVDFEASWRHRTMRPIASKGG